MKLNQQAQQLCRRVGARYPIVQAPMAGMSTHPRFTSAALRAGIVGSLGLGYLPPRGVKETIDAVRLLSNDMAKGAGPLNVNLFAAEQFTVDPAVIREAVGSLRPHYAALGVEPPAIPADAKPSDFAPSFDDQFAALLKTKPEIFSFTFNVIAADHIRALRANGIVSMGTATNQQEVDQLAELGVDYVVLQGGEAGGHRGTFVGSWETALQPLRQLVASSNCKHIPYLVAGGLTTGADVSEALSWSTTDGQHPSGVVVGTAFLVADESPVPPEYKQAILRSKAGGTDITTAFSGRAARGVTNKFMNEMKQRNAVVAPYPIQHRLTVPLRQAAVKQGRTVDYANLWCGEGGVRATPGSVQSIVDLLVSG